MRFLRHQAANLFLGGIAVVSVVYVVSSVVPGANGKPNLQLLIDFIDWTIVAAFVQGFAAIAIVALTYQLAQTARAALTTSADQVKAAQEATMLTRRDAHIAAVPRLELTRANWIDTLDIPEEPDKIVLRLTNQGDQPALDVHITATESDAVGGTSGKPTVDEPIGSLLPTTPRIVVLDMYLLRNKGKPNESRVPVGAPWASNTIVVAVEFRAPLGQLVALNYLWTANHPNQSDPGVWQLVEYRVQPDIEGAQPLRMHFGGW